jgi:large subunit ribosomal protein L29
MDVKTLRDLTVEELIEKEKEMKRELFNLRFQAVTGRMENPSRVRGVRREIAQIKTVYSEKRSGKTGGKTGEKK